MNRRILPPTILFAALIVMVALHLFSPLTRLVGFPWNTLGAVPLPVGVWLNLAADKALKDHDTTVKPFQESAALVTDGVYRRSRHPMYLGFVLILLGLAVLMGSFTPFIVIPFFAFLMDSAFIRIEEKMLEENFAQQWAAYKARVRRWL